MNRLIVIVGASGSGKTTLANALNQTGRFAIAYEQHKERPFQALFKQDKRFALANQIDYLLLRAEQEYDLRFNSSKIGLMDGGLDLDFHGFTRLFHRRGLISDSEFDLCRRFYLHTRALLPSPDLIVALSADEETISRRLASRNRINIASASDAALMDRFIDEWLESIPPNQILRADTSNEDQAYARTVKLIFEML